jgi:hypothetical protein
MQICDVQLEGGHLSPVNWRVRDAISPLTNAWGWRWWALLWCDQGLVGLRWPAPKFWLEQWRLARWRYGSPIPDYVWPLSERGVVRSPSALIFARDHLTHIQIMRGFMWNKVLLHERNGEQSTFVFANHRQIDRCTHLLRRHHFDQAN